MTSILFSVAQWLSQETGHTVGIIRVIILQLISSHNTKATMQLIIIYVFESKDVILYVKYKEAFASTRVGWESTDCMLNYMMA